MVLLIRTIHGLLSAFFLACIGFVYYAVIADVDSPLVIAAAGALILEGLVVALNGGDCPLGGIHRRYGDEKAFFELVLPPRAAKLAVPVLGTVTAVGIVLVFVF
jgi:hypothetical protein